MKVVVLNYSSRTVDVVLNVPDISCGDDFDFYEFMEGLGYPESDCRFMTIKDNQDEVGEVCECIKSQDTDEYYTYSLGPLNF